MRSFFRFFLAFLVMLAGSANAASTSKPLEVIVFPGGFNWPIWVAQDKGFFADNHVSINVTPTPSSSFQLSGLIDGKFDIAMTAFDNLVAYREGQGETDKVGPDLVAVMGADRGFLKLVSVPEVKAIADLRGKTVSVDARNTGYAAVLFEMLDRAGLREPDYTVVRAGGVLQRFKELLEKKQAATMLISPFEVPAQAQGFHVLGVASEMFGAYQGLVAGARQSWAQQNRDRLEGYIRAYVQAVEWLYDPANRQEALSIFVKHMPNTTDQAAQAIYGILLDPKTGMQRKAAIELPGMEQVLKLRSKWGQPRRELTDPLKYYDASFYDAALKH
ncbi:ABC transporter substrate-binding protein [Eoetvoesiella caeni]|uniref:ABC-type nitrate/sulfonate/bicarbonate transport system substrate-binding protein n=1 Tax=Eoetvoesiella caeni TaxID=645616 RepID=A0A366H849_9BURK|nr:ABC transporter substrate-binding protein [Eoetvoesiella caeni]MCI2809770.1 ABC transporter substrate-binding protein [Eoetvoesiella caeni]NYT56315.1 ABC transporter substrate-binding protein [Eoetvoesiella caeni]RBP38373.1 ABC-type nitrate/sulfonate/bicarbonate transport system substrate-binding protein [Eoetvoesiella caeni]